MSSPYITLYTARLIQTYLRRQPFCINTLIVNPDAWLPPLNIHKHFEKPRRGEDEGGASLAQKITPLVEIKSPVANPIEPRFMGNWTVDVELCITNSTRDTTDEEHESRVNDVLALFYRDEIITDLMGLQPEFWCGKVNPGSMSDHIEGISMSTSVAFRFFDCHA